MKFLAFVLGVTNAAAQFEVVEEESVVLEDRILSETDVDAAEPDDSESDGWFSSLWRTFTFSICCVFFKICCYFVWIRVPFSCFVKINEGFLASKQDNDQEEQEENSPSVFIARTSRRRIRGRR